MKQFSFARVARILNFSYTLSRATTLRYTLMCFAIYLLIFMAFSWDGNDLHAHAADMLMSSLVAIFIFAPAGWLSGISKKQSRIDALMLPATNLEKFTVRYFMPLLCGTFAIIVGWLLADVAQWLVNLATRNPQAMLVTPVAVSSPWIEPFTFGHTLAVVLVMVHSHSLYLLGGTIFRKRPWLTTTLAIMAFSMAVIMAVVGIAMSMEGYAEAHNGHFEINILAIREDGSWLTHIVFAALIVFNYWLSYRLFSRMQLATRRFFNF